LVTTGKINVEVAFRSARLGYPATGSGYDTDEEVWQILPQIVADGTRVIRALDAPPPGKYIIKARLTKLSSFDLNYSTSGTNIFEIDHEVW